MRRQTREEIQNLFDLERKNLEEEIRRIEKEDIMEYEIRKRQDWIQKYKEEHNGKPPDKMDKYVDRLFSDNPLSPEEEAALAGGDEDKGKKKGGEKKDVKKDGKGKKDGKKKKEEDKENQKKVNIGPTEVVMKFEEFYEDFETVWGKRDEEDNTTQ